MARKHKAKTSLTAREESSSTAQPTSDWFQSIIYFRLEIGLAAALMAAVWLVFLATANFALLAIGDGSAVTGNRLVRDGLSLTSAWFVFFDGGAGNWTPLTWISHMLDTQLDGFSPAGRHHTNTALHVMSSGLFFVLLSRLTGAPWRSFAAAMFFALHPLRAQSVAWVADRQTLLAGFFAFASLAAWAYWRVTGSGLARGCALAAFACALMASPAAVAVAPVLVLLEHWPLQNGDGVKWREKLPYFGMALAALGIWAWRYRMAAQAGGGEGGGASWQVAAAFWPALYNTVWPVELTPVAGFSVPGQGAWAGWAVLAGLAGIAVLLGRRFRFLWVGLAWFVAALVASLVLSEFAFHSYADRFTYFAHAGLAIAVVWAGHALLAERAQFVAVPLGLLMAWQCWVQLDHWRDDTAVMTRAAALSPADVRALIGLGEAYREQGNLGKSIESYRRAVEVDSRSVEARLQLAAALGARSEKQAALDQIEEALRIDPKSGSALFDRGLALRALDRQEEASLAFLRALEAGVSSERRQEALLNLGLIAVKSAQQDEALKYFLLALDRNPEFYLARKNVAFIYLKQQRWDEAQREFDWLMLRNTEDEDVIKAKRFLRQRVK